MTLGLKPRGSCVVDWKSTVVWDLLAVLLFDVLADHLVGDCPGADRQVSSRPEMPSPELLFQVRKLLQQYARADPFQPLHHLTHVLIRSVGQEQVNVIARHLPGHDLQLVFCGDLPQ